MRKRITQLKTTLRLKKAITHPINQNKKPRPINYSPNQRHLMIRKSKAPEHLKNKILGYCIISLSHIQLKSHITNPSNSSQTNKMLSCSTRPGTNLLWVGDKMQKQSRQSQNQHLSHHLIVDITKTDRPKIRLRNIGVLLKQKNH